MSDWEPELLESLPEEFTKLGEDLYVQRKDIHEVTYHSLDGSETFKGFECFSREISQAEYTLLVKGDKKNGLHVLQSESSRKIC